MQANKNRTREANNPRACLALETGINYYNKKDFRWAYKYFESAAAGGHSRAAHWLKKTADKLSMADHINAEEYYQNLLESNRKPSTPEIAPSFRLPKENKARVTVLSQDKNGTTKSPTQNKNQSSQNADIAQPSSSPEYDRLKKRAKAGDSEAQYQMGLRRCEQARRYLEKAAAQNHEEALQLLNKITEKTEEAPRPSEEVPQPSEQATQSSEEAPQPSEQVPPPEQTIGSGQITPSAELLQFNYLYQPHTPCGCLPTLKLVWQLIHYYLHQKLFSCTEKNARK